MNNRSFIESDWRRVLEQGPQILEIIEEKYPGFGDIIEPLLKQVRVILERSEPFGLTPEDPIFPLFDRLARRCHELIPDFGKQESFWQEGLILVELPANVRDPIEEVQSIDETISLLNDLNTFALCLATFAKGQYPPGWNP